jgi:dolichol kinase
MVDPMTDAADTLRSRVRQIQGEAFRKGLHALGCVWALWGYWWPWLTILGLTLFAVIYVIYDALRLRGRGLDVVERVGRFCRRRREEARPALGPVVLAAGVIVCFLVFAPHVACAAVLAGVGCDCAASLAGKLWGRHAIPFSPLKTLEGSLAGLGVAFVACAPVAGVVPGLIAALVAAAAESLPLEDMDNIVVPVATACVLALMLGSR